MLTNTIGIDLGTANSVVVARRRGIVAKEPSVVAVNRRTKAVVAVGASAHQMIGRAPADILPVRPITNGVISDLNHSTTLLKHLLRGYVRGRWFRPRVILAHQGRVPEVDRRALAEAAVQAGAGEVLLMEKAVAAAMGAGLPVHEARGSLLVDIGSGSTTAAVISLGGVVVSDSVDAAGDQMNEAVIRYMRREHGLLIGDLTAERIKHELGSAIPGASGTLTVAGRLVATGNPVAIQVTSEEIYGALMDTLAQIDTMVTGLFERIPPELLGDISRNGMALTGGGALLRGMDQRLAQVTALPVQVADAPLASVAMGTAMVLEGRQKANLVRVKP